jgi:hypothetical protein
MHLDQDQSRFGSCMKKHSHMHLDQGQGQSRFGGYKNLDHGQRKHQTFSSEVLPLEQYFGCLCLAGACFAPA